MLDKKNTTNCSLVKEIESTVNGVGITSSTAKRKMKLKIVCFVLIVIWPFNSCQHFESTDKENVVDDNQVLVKTQNGVVRGVRKAVLGETVDVFLGVRYL